MKKNFVLEQGWIDIFGHTHRSFYKEQNGIGVTGVEKESDATRYTLDEALVKTRELNKIRGVHFKVVKVKEK